MCSLCLGLWGGHQEHLLLAQDCWHSEAGCLLRMVRCHHDGQLRLCTAVCSPGQETYPSTQRIPLGQCLLPANPGSWADSELALGVMQAKAYWEKSRMHCYLFGCWRHHYLTSEQEMAALQLRSQSPGHTRSILRILPASAAVILLLRRMRWEKPVSVSMFVTRLTSI